MSDEVHNYDHGSFYLQFKRCTIQVVIADCIRLKEFLVKTDGNEVALSFLFFSSNFCPQLKNQAPELGLSFFFFFFSDLKVHLRVTELASKGSHSESESWRPFHPPPAVSSPGMDTAKKQQSFRRSGQLPNLSI